MFKYFSFEMVTIRICSSSLESVSFKKAQV